MKLLFLLIIILITVSACDYMPNKIFSSGTDTEGSTSGYITQDIISPKEGSSISRDSPLSPVIQLVNTGPANTNGQVCITGLDSMSFRGFNGCDCNVFSMQKEEKSFLPESVSFGPYYIVQDEKQDYTLTAITRYKYQTVAKAKLCLKDNADDMALCNAELISSNDGPIRVLGLEQQTSKLSDKDVSITLLINADKQTEGELWDTNAVQELCRPERQLRKTIRTQIKGLPFRASGSCTDTKMEDDEAVITCNLGEVTLGQNFGSAYSPEIEITLDYAFEIRNSNEFSVE